MTVLVTGAASGIGAHLLAMLGHGAIGVDRTPVAGGLVCDLADPDALAALADRIDGPLTGIAHVAGLPGTADPAAILAVNTLAPVMLTATLLTKLADSASIVCVSSVTALRCEWSSFGLDELIDEPRAQSLIKVAALEGARAYELSKAAINRWTVRMAAQLQPRSIRVNTVSPGPVQTPILADFETSIGKNRLDAAKAMTGRHGLPAEIASVIAFLLSDGARWINGADIRVDGGYHAVRAMSER